MPTATASTTASTAGTTRTATDNSTDNNTDNGGGGGGSGGGVNNNNISNTRMMYKNKSKRHNRFLGSGKNNGNNNDRIRRNKNSITTRYYIFLMFILIGIILQFSTIIKDSSVQTIQQYYNDMPTTITTNTNTTTTVTITASASGATSTIRGVVPDISELSKYMTTTYNNNNNNNNDNTNNDENENNDNDDDNDDDDDEDDDQFAEEEEFEDGGIEPPEFEDGSSQTDDNGNGNDNDNDNDNDKNKNENNNENNNNNFYYNTTYAEMNDPLFNIVPSTYRRNNNNNNNIPNWMKEYFDWHRIQTFKLNETNWNTDTIQTTYKSRKDKDNPNINITIPISIPVPMLSSSTTNNNNNNNTANKFLIIRCLNQDRCGGLSDRIKPLLMFIAVAAHTKRILLIRWERPYPLEEYLIPNEINWTVPFYILEELQKDDYHIKMKRGGQQNLIGMTISRTFLAGPAIHTFIRNNKHSIVEANLQLDDGGARYYQCIVETMLYNNNNSSNNNNSNTTINTNNDEYNNSNNTSKNISFKQYKRQQHKNKNKSHVRLFNYSKYKEDYFHCCGKFGDKLFGHYLLDTGIESYKRIYHDFFQSIFKPSKNVQYLIESKMKGSNLVPGQFIGSHYRSDYGPGEAERIGKDMISNSAITQVRCAARMRPGYPVYFAGDSQIAINAVQNDALVLKTKNKNITIITAASDIDIDIDENNNIDSNNNNNNDTTKKNNEVRVPKQQQQQTRSSSKTSGPLHIEFDKGAVEDFYPAFVDLLVMGNSMCQLYGIGGFGSFASLLSYNASCYYSTMKCNGSEGHYLPDKCCMKELYQNNAKSTRIGDVRRKRKEQKELAASLNNSTV